MMHFSSLPTLQRQHVTPLFFLKLLCRIFQQQKELPLQYEGRGKKKNGWVEMGLKALLGYTDQMQLVICHGSSEALQELPAYSLKLDLCKQD